jgi:hypothetical protein
MSQKKCIKKLLKKMIIDEKILEKELNIKKSDFSRQFKGNRECMSQKYILISRKCNCIQCELSKRFPNEYKSKIYKLKTSIDGLKKDLLEIDENDLNYMLKNMSLINNYALLDNQTDVDFNKIQEQKQELCNQYLHDNEIKNYDKPHEISFKCNNCNIDLIIDESNDTLMNCKMCGYTITVFNTDTPLSYKESQDYIYKSKFMYDKKSHLIEWLSRITSSENKAIPQELIDRIMIEIEKEKITDLKTLNEKRIKKYLKKINMTSYYDNTISIINRINGRAPFKLTEQIIEKLHEMFQKTRPLFEKYKKKDRRNFFSYSFLLTQFFKILDLQEFTYYLPKLKSQDKIREQDEIFEKIVKELAPIDKSINWKFFSSV